MREKKIWHSCIRCCLAFCKDGFLWGAIPGSKLEQRAATVRSNLSLSSGWKRCLVARNVDLGLNLVLASEWNACLFVQSAYSNLEGLASGR